MRLSPGFDNQLPDFSPRPSIPLEPISLGSLKYSPPKLDIKPPSEVKPSLPHLQPVDISTFFKQSSQPKPSLPTLSHPKIKITPKIVHPILKKVPISPPVKQTQKTTQPTPIKLSAPPIQ